MPPPEPLSRRFGLTSEQFAENLRDTYQRHEVEQFPSDPDEIAQQYITGYVTGWTWWLEAALPLPDRAPVALKRWVHAVSLTLSLSLSLTLALLLVLTMSQILS